MSFCFRALFIFSIYSFSQNATTQSILSEGFSCFGTKQNRFYMPQYIPRDQGEWGNCYAQSETALMEAAQFRETGTLSPLSIYSCIGSNLIPTPEKQNALLENSKAPFDPMLIRYSRIFDSRGDPSPRSYSNGSILRSDHALNIHNFYKPDHPHAKLIKQSVEKLERVAQKTIQGFRDTIVDSEEFEALINKLNQNIDEAVSVLKIQLQEEGQSLDSKELEFYLEKTKKEATITIFKNLIPDDMKKNPLIVNTISEFLIKNQTEFEDCEKCLQKVVSQNVPGAYSAHPSKLEKTSFKPHTTSCNNEQLLRYIQARACFAIPLDISLLPSKDLIKAFVRHSEEWSTASLENGHKALFSGTEIINGTQHLLISNSKYEHPFLAIPFEHACDIIFSVNTALHKHPLKEDISEAEAVALFQEEAPSKDASDALLSAYKLYKKRFADKSPFVTVFSEKEAPAYLNSNAYTFEKSHPEGEAFTPHKEK